MHLLPLKIVFACVTTAAHAHLRELRLRVMCTAYGLKAQPARCAGLTVTMDAHLPDNVP